MSWIQCFFFPSYATKICFFDNCLNGKIEIKSSFFANRTDAGPAFCRSTSVRTATTHTSQLIRLLRQCCATVSARDDWRLPSETRVEALTDVVEVELWHPEFLGEICLCGAAHVTIPPLRAPAPHAHTPRSTKGCGYKKLLSFSFFSLSSASQLCRLPVQNSWKMTASTSVHTVCCVWCLVLLLLSVWVTRGPWPVHAGVWF